MVFFQNSPHTFSKPWYNFPFSKILGSTESYVTLYKYLTQSYFDSVCETKK